MNSCIRLLTFSFLYFGLVHFCNAQINFEDGYIIDNSGKKTECLIKNVDWEDNPSQINYRLSDGAPVQSGELKDIKEFGIYDLTKFIKSTVRIDKASDDLEDIGFIKDRPLEEDELFLKVIVDGNAKLYEWKENNMIRYFYSVNDSKVEPLIYNTYYFKNKSQLKENNYYQQQIFTTLKCSTSLESEVKNLEYKIASLKSVFSSFNTCSGSEFTDYDIKDKQESISLSIRPRINFNSLSVARFDSPEDEKVFEDKMTGGLGLQAELFLPFHNGKWSLFFEPTYRYYSSTLETKLPNIASIVTSDVTYNSIELPFGLRHYFFFNKGNALFLNAILLSDIIMTGHMINTNSDGNPTLGSREFSSLLNYGAGVGYIFLDRYSLELRYHNTRDLLRNYDADYSNFENISLIAGYKLF